MRRLRQGESVCLAPSGAHSLPCSLTCQANAMAAKNPEIIPGEFVASDAVSFSALCVPPLCDHVPLVVSVISDEQVIGIAARRVVAFVADKHAAWDRAIRKNPCKSVRSPPHVLETDHPVSLAMTKAIPIPATVID